MCRYRMVDFESSIELKQEKKKAEYQIELNVRKFITRLYAYKFLATKCSVAHAWEATRNM